MIGIGGLTSRRSGKPVIPAYREVVEVGMTPYLLAKITAHGKR